MKQGDASESVPPGWAYNPAAWSERLPIVALALTGFGIATYMAAYQLNFFGEIWDPFFEEGARRILNSRISHILPIPDAALGAFGYLLDAVTGVIGGVKRWRTMPWIVLLFGLAVGPLGFVSIMLVVFQPVLLDSWCTLCLASAVISVLMIGPAMDDVLASLQHLRQAKEAGRSVWRTFWGLDR